MPIDNYFKIFFFNKKNIDVFLLKKKRNITFKITIPFMVQVTLYIYISLKLDIDIDGIWEILLSILLFKGIPYLDSSYIYIYIYILFKNTHTPLCLSRHKTKGQSGKNILLTPTKILPKK